jgi:acyl-CoA dehydrogenase
MDETPEHSQFRATVRRFFRERVAPQMPAWEAAGVVDRRIWREAGALGLLCPGIAKEHGGLGLDFSFSTIICEEQAYAGLSAPSFGVHSETVTPYIADYGSDALKAKWLPRLISGEAVAALGMTEPGAGSDAKALKTSARRRGDSYVINGAKTFITNGELADIVVLAARTGGAAGARGISLILVETDRPGFRRGRRLNKIGLRAQDTVELFLDEVEVPVANLIGEEGQGFTYLMAQLPKERMMIAITAVAAAAAALEWSVEHARWRTAFGRTVAEFQNTRFKLADVRMDVALGSALVEKCLAQMRAGSLAADMAAIAKCWCSEMQTRVMDTCLQIFGGYGFILDYPIARAYVDSRAQRIYGGTNEIMRELIARGLLGRAEA